MADLKIPDASSVTEAWRETLKAEGYNPPKITARACLKFALLSRTWRRILRHTGLKRFKSVRALEFGCGGGIHLVPLYVNGWSCTGVDCSEEVLSRARDYADAANSSCKARGSIDFACTDFISFEPEGALYDLTVQFGVLEHFLNDDDRLRYLQKMFDITRPGGFIVSAVPNGCHPMRSEQRDKGLGGYLIPEIDYSREIIVNEMRQCGAVEVKVLPHDLFGYLRLMQTKGLRKYFTSLAYYLFQFPAFQLLPLSLQDRHANWWLAISRKADS